MLRPSHPRSVPPLPSRRHHVLHLVRNGSMSAAFIVASLALGAVGYHRLAGLEWLDSFLNAFMILTGMGPIAPLTTDFPHI